MMLAVYPLDFTPQLALARRDPPPDWPDLLAEAHIECERGWLVREGDGYAILLPWGERRHPPTPDVIAAAKIGGVTLD